MCQRKSCIKLKEVKYIGKFGKSHLWSHRFSFYEFLFFSHFDNFVIPANRVRLSTEAGILGCFNRLG